LNRGILEYQGVANALLARRSDEEPSRLVSSLWLASEAEMDDRGQNRPRQFPGAAHELEVGAERAQATDTLGLPRSRPL
jgi:hypothetical protein